MRESEAEFKQLSKKAWAADATLNGGASVTRLSSSVSMHVQLTSSDTDAAPLRQLLTFLLT
jgi:hypothetical protein